MKKYFVAHILEGEVAEFCKQASADLTEIFSVSDPHESVMPHLTLKAPFTADSKQIMAVKDKLHMVASESEPTDLHFKKFNHFNHGVIYLDVKPSDLARSVSKNLTRALLDLEWISKSKHDQDITFHATLVRPNSHDQFQEIFTYLQNTYQPDFSAKFDNIALLEKEGSKSAWNVSIQHEIRPH